MLDSVRVDTARRGERVAYDDHFAYLIGGIHEALPHRVAAARHSDALRFTRALTSVRSRDTWMGHGVTEQVGLGEVNEVRYRKFGNRQNTGRERLHESTDASDGVYGDLHSYTMN